MNWVWIGLWLFAGTVVSRAVVTRPLSIEELTQRSDLIVEGRVTAISCHRDAAGRIYTRVELTASDWWKGASTADRVVVVHSGGIVGEERVRVGGQVEYALDEEVIVFARWNLRGEAVAISLGQGKFQVARDAVSKSAYTWNLFHGRRPRLRDDVGAIQRQAGEEGGAELLTVTELKRRVRESSR